MKTRIKYVSLSVLLAVVFGRCLSIIPGALTTEINTTGMEPGVLVEVLQDGKVVESHETPVTFPIRTASGVILRFSKPGYYPVSVRTYATTESNLIAQSCLISIPTAFGGALYDDSTGALRQVRPNEFRFKLVPVPGNTGRDARESVPIAVVIPEGISLAIY